MRNKTFLHAAAASLVLLAGTAVQAQTYSNAVMSLSPAPAAYWPLNETTQPPSPINLTAANYGSLGAQGNGFYGAWYQPSGTTWYLTNSIVQTQAVTYPFDGSLAMQCQGAPGQYVIVPRNTNGVVNPSLTLNPPFSLEAWVRIGRTNDALGTIVSQGAFAKLSTGGADPANPYYGGLGSGWAGVELGQYDDYVFIICNATNGTSKNNELDSSSTYHLQNQHKGFNPGDWVHVVGTFDGTTQTLYTNGVRANSKNLPNNGAGIKYVADPTTPIMIGCNSQDTSQNTSIAYNGSIHDVAIYPTVLSQQSVLNHFQTAYGTNATYGSVYTNAVLADAPSLYYRLNDPVYCTNAGYTAASFPAAANYGALGATAAGVYQPGTQPGVAGPAYSGFGANSKAVALNGWLGQVDVGGATLPTALNPASNAPLTVVSWFQTAPADAPARYQDLVGHGDTGYRLELDNNSGGNSFTPGSGANNGQAQFDNQADLKTNNFACNDGKWHMVAGVYDYANASVLMYLDGLLAKSNHLSAALSFVGSTNDLLLGGSSQYTFASAGGSSTIRTFDGQIAQVAIWTNALSGTQIQSLYGAAGVPPILALQPPASLTVNAGTNLSIPVVARGSAPFSYQWYRTGGSPVAGQTTASLTFNPVALGNAGTYYVVVTNTAGAITSTSMALTVNGPPVIQAQSPTSIRVFTGTHPALRVSATGPQPISYQWSVGGSPISGATASSYLPSTASTGTSTYSCAITNLYGSTPFSTISVQVLSAPTAPYPAQVLAGNPAYYFRLDEADNGLGNGNFGVTAWDYAGGLNATYTNTLLGQTGYSQGVANQDAYSPATEPDETSAAFDQTTTADSFAGNGSSLLSFAAPAGSNAQFSVEAWFNAPYQPTTDAGLVAIGYGYGGEQFALDCGAKIGGTRTLRFYVNDANGANHGISATNPTILGDNLWHHVVAICDEAGGKLSLYVDGILSSSGTISSGAGLKALTLPLSIGARLPSGGDTSYTNQFVGNIDDVSLYNYALSPSQVVSHYLAAGIPPVIVQAPPSTISTNEGNTVVLSANVVGSATLNYQWQLFGGNISGATTSTLVLPNVTAGMSGNIYTLTIYNTYGSASTANSGGTTLTVTAGPPLLATDLQPLNATNYVGNSFTYSVGVEGTAPFTYQWFHNGSLISGPTGSSYTFATPSGQNTYYVHVANANGSTNSSTATLAGIPVPTLNPSDYNYKAKITFAGYNRAEVLSDFPALVVLTNIPGFAYSQLASPVGGDLRFTDASGTRELPHEVDDWNPAGASTVWVQVPRLGTNTDSIWAYWGNPSATTPLAWSTNGGVWTPQPFEGLPVYQIVYHLKEGGYPYLDSTTLHTATNGSATGPGATAGPVGTAASFGGGNYLDAGTNNFGDAFTLSTWLNIPSATVNIQSVWMEMHGGFGAPGFGLWVNTYNNSDNIIEFGSGGTGGAETKSSAGAFPFGGWHQLEASINRTNGTVTYFVDGTSLGVLNGVVTDFVQTNDLRLGMFLDNNFGIHGGMDEARVQAANSSANWIWADYMTMGQNSAFQSYSPAVSSIVYIDAQELGGKLVLSWPNGTLLEAPAVTGPWTTNLNTSPYTNTPSGAQHFYRIRVR